MNAIFKDLGSCLLVRSPLLWLFAPGRGQKRNISKYFTALYVFFYITGHSQRLVYLYTLYTFILNSVVCKKTVTLY